MIETLSGNLQRHDVTDLVLKKLRSFSQLNPKTKSSENPTQKREQAFRQKLEKIVNQSRVAEFKEGEGSNLDLFQLLDENCQKRPILVKVIKPERQEQANDMESAHKLHVDLLGEEFVEDMTRVSITNIEILKKYNTGNKEVKSLEAFVQDLRGTEQKRGLFSFLLTTDLSKISPELKGKLKIFFERILDAYIKGYGFELDIFPLTEPEISDSEKRAGIIIDNEGITFIDTNLIYKVSESNDWKIDFNDLRRAIRIFTGEINPKKIFIIKGNYDGKHQISQNNLGKEVLKLKNKLKKIH